MIPPSRVTGPALIQQIAWPLFGESLLGISVGLVGLALASHTSEAASGAFALANSVQAAFLLLLRVISLAVSVTITQELVPATARWRTPRRGPRSARAPGWDSPPRSASRRAPDRCSRS